MPNFMVLIYDDERKWSEGAEGVAEARAQHRRFAERRRAQIAGGEALQPTSTATSVWSTESGQVRVTDGPYVETKEALGGFYLIEADDLDAAVELAKEVPAPFGGLEVRPVMVFG